MVLKFPKDQKDQIVANIQQYVSDELSEDVGSLQAELLLDFVTKQVEPILYNQAISDARKLVGERMLAIEEDLYALEKNPVIARGGRK